MSLPVLFSGDGAGGSGGNRGLVLDADPTFRGRVLDGDPLNSRYQSWDNDPAYADRVGRYRSGGPYMALTDKSFGSIFTFSRASKAWDFDAYGLLGEVAADNIRQGYDPATKLPAGWLIEGPATNYVRNSVQAGAAPGSPGVPPNNFQLGNSFGVNVAVSGMGTEYGMPYVDYEFSGTATALAFATLWLEGTTTAPAAQNEVMTGSAWARLISGSIPGTCLLRFAGSEHGAGGGYLASSAKGATQTPGASLTQIVGAITMAMVGCAFYRPALELRVPQGDTVAFILRLYYPQVEKGAFPTSTIPTAGAAATRAADNLSITGSQFASLFGSGAPQGCIILDLTPAAVLPTPQVVANISDGTNNNRYTLRIAATTGFVAGDIVAGGGAATSTGVAGTITAGAQTRVGLRWSNGVIAACKDGGPLQGLTGTHPSNLSAARLGNRAAGDQPYYGRISLARALAYAPDDAPYRNLCTLGA